MEIHASISSASSINREVFSNKFHRNGVSWHIKDVVNGSRKSGDNLIGDVAFLIISLGYERFASKKSDTQQHLQYL